MPCLYYANLNDTVDAILSNKMSFREIICQHQRGENRGDDVNVALKDDSLKLKIVRHNRLQKERGRVNQGFKPKMRSKRQRKSQKQWAVLEQVFRPSSDDRGGIEAGKKWKELT